MVVIGQRSFGVSRAIVWMWLQGGSQDRGESGKREEDGVALHAAGAESFFAQVGNVGLGEAVGGEAWDGKVGGQGANPFHAVLRRGIGAPSEEPCGLDVSSANGGVGGCKVGFHDGGQQGGADGPVWGIEGSPNGRSKTVHSAKACICQCHSAEERAERHVFACRRVTPDLGRSEQGATDSDEAFSAERVGQRVGFARDEGFEDLGEGIESGCGRDRPREGVGEVRVHDRHGGQHGRAAEADFHRVFWGMKDGVARCFCTGTGCCGNGHPRNRRFFDGASCADDLCVVEWVAAVGQEHGDGFSGIDGASPSYGDDMITSGIATEGRSEANAFKVGFARDFEGFGGGGFERCRQRRVQACEGAMGDEEQSTAEGLGDAGNFR